MKVTLVLSSFMLLSTILLIEPKPVPKLVLKTPGHPPTRAKENYRTNRQTFKYLHPKTIENLLNEATLSNNEETNNPGNKTYHNNKMVQEIKTD